MVGWGAGFSVIPFMYLCVSSPVRLLCPAEDAPWYESTNMQITLITAAVALTLLVLMVFMTVFLCRRAKQAKTSKGPM